MSKPFFQTRCIVGALALLVVPMAAAQAPAGASRLAQNAPAAASTSTAASADVIKWLTQTSAQFDASYQKEVQGPFDAGLAVLQKNYLASVNQAMETATTARKLEEAQWYRAEREKFLGAGHKPSDDDSDNPSNVVRALRSAFRKQFAQLDFERFQRGKAMHSKYDPTLAQMELALMQRQRTADAALIKTKRAELSKVWLQPPASSPGEARAGATTKAPTPPRVEVNKETIRQAVEWVISVGGTIAVLDGKMEKEVSSASQLPAGQLTVARIVLDGPKLHKTVEDADLAMLVGLRSVRSMESWGIPMTDAGLGFVDGWKDLESIRIGRSRVSDASVPRFARFDGLHTLALRGDPDLTGKTFDKLAGLRNLRLLDLENSGIKDEGLAAISQLKGLEDLSLINTGITNAGLTHLGTLHKLKKLDVGGNNLTNSALTPLLSLRALEDFGFLTSGLTDYPAAVKQISTAWPRMRSLRFIGGEFKPEHIEPLLSLRGIKELHFQNVDVSEAALTALGKMSALEELALILCTLSDGQFTAVAGLKKVRVLRLNSTNITDANLQKLKTMKGLKLMEVPGTEVTAAGIMAFEKDVPGCRVIK